MKELRAVNNKVLISAAEEKAPEVVATGSSRDNVVGAGR